MQRVLRDIFAFDREEGPRAHMQRDEGAANTFGRQPFKKLRREMKARGRRGDCAFRFSVHGLVIEAVAIIGGARPGDIRRYRHVSVAGHDRFDCVAAAGRNHDRSLFVPRRDLQARSSPVPGKDDGVSRAEAPGGTGKCLPSAVRKPLNQRQREFDVGSAGFPKKDDLSAISSFSMATRSASVNIGVFEG